MSTPGGLVDKQELLDAQLDTAHLGRVVNSKDASGAPISTSTNRTGGVNKTLDALEGVYQGQIDTLEARTDTAITDAEAEFATQRDQFGATFQAQFQYAKIGNISAYVGDTLQEADKLNSYQYPDDSDEWYGPIQDRTFPITIPADPTTPGSGWALVTAATQGWVSAGFTANTETIVSLKSLNPINIKTVFLTDEDSGLFKFSSGDLSGFVSQDVNESVWIAPNSDPTGTSGAWERQSGQIYKDLSFTLSGSIDTLKKAVNYFSKFFPATADTTIDVTTPAGYVQDDQILIYGKNLSFVRFKSTDSIVPVNAAVWVGPITEVGYTPCISVKNGAIAHFDIVFDAGETVTADQSKAGYIVRTGAKLLSSGTVDLHLGFKNLNGRGCYIVQNAIAQVNYGDFSNCFQGLRASNQGFAQVRWGNVSNCKNFGLMCDSSYINASSINGDDCDSFAISTNNGNLMCINSVARRSTLNSVQVVNNGNLVATDSDFSDGASALVATGGDFSANGVNLSGTAGDAIDARTGAKVSVPSSNLSGSSVGVRARFGASVDATGANGSGCGTGIICDNAEVYANSDDVAGADFSGCGTGVLATNSGVVRCDNINVSGATVTGLNAGNGAQIFAASANADNCARPMQATAGGEVRTPNGSCINRTSQNRALTGGIIFAQNLTTDSGTPGAADFAGSPTFNVWDANGVIYANV